LGYQIILKADVVYRSYWYPYFDVVVGLALSNDSGSYADNNLAIGGASNARQVKGIDPEEKGYPGSPGWGWAWG
jgi:hypothetical protein